ncbi:MAG: gliding motility-associated C-terminal domain-containing protein [Chitinophagaceae bacterium]|nr:gliding motility-associated C-terminal domain-containing protein [Chitinophagaceae bacterium]
MKQKFSNVFLRRFTAFLLPVLCFIAIGNDAKASHLAAADLYITYVGGGADGCSGTTEYKYVVTFDIYRACEGGATAPTSVSIQWGSVNAGVNGNLNMNQPIRDTLDQLCAAFKPINSCRQPSSTSPYPGYIRHRFQDTLILPSAQTDWKFSWSSCCRNSGIVNLTSNGSMYIEAGLNNLTKYNNSTPRYVVDPLPYICAGQPATYLNGPIDPNGDSMRSYVQEPLQGPANPIAYGAGYSIGDPIGSNGTFKFDSVTATANFTPANQGKYVMAFRCDEYERGTQIPLGYIMRDVQVTIFNCSAPPPAVDPLPLTLDDISVIEINGEKALIACPGSNISFDISTKSQSSTSAVFLEANTNNIPGSNFTTTGGGTSQVSGTFSWTPTKSDIGEHTLIITGKDSTCSGTGFSIVLKSYTVLQLKIVEGLDAGKDQPICELNPDSVQLFVRGTENLKFTWSTADGGPLYMSNSSINNPRALPPKTTSYIIEAPELKGACKSKDTVVVFVDETNKVEITPKNPTDAENAMVLCRPAYVQLEALLSGKPPKNNVACGTGNPTLCSSPETAIIYGSPIFGSLTYDSVGQTAPVMFNTIRSSKYQFLINRNELQNADMFSSTIRSLAFETKGTSNPTYESRSFKIFVKCTNKETLNPGDGFENFGLVQVYSAPSVTFEDGMHTFQFTTPYNWDTTKNLIIQMCYSDNPTVEVGCGVSSSPPVVTYVPTTYMSGLSLAAPDATTLSVCGVDKNASIEAVPARPVFTFTYCEADPLPFQITWKGEYLSDTTVMQPLAYVPKSTKYVVETIGRSGCLMKDTLEIYVPKHDFKVTPTDTAVCYGVGTPVSAYGGWYYKWYEYDGTDIYKDATGSLNCPSCPEPFVRPAKTTDYRIVISDSVWCYDTLSARVEILPLPDVHILNQDTTVKYGSKFQLLASGARLFNWSPVSSLSNPNISYPMATPTEDTRYVVGGIGANGCRAFDTLYVTVDKRDHIMVPGAFSPNGDGKNDVFKITNLTFQRIMEFRVFNRWGQEIFNTTDNNRGWDGTWKGEPQGIGTYNYLIRVASPDGHVDTFTGAVTLIR